MSSPHQLSPLHIRGHDRLVGNLSPKATLPPIGALPLTAAEQQEWTGSKNSPRAHPENLSHSASKPGEKSLSLSLPHDNELGEDSPNSLSPNFVGSLSFARRKQKMSGQACSPMSASAVSPMNQSMCSTNHSLGSAVELSPAQDDMEAVPTTYVCPPGHMAGGRTKVPNELLEIFDPDVDGSLPGGVPMN